MGWGHLDGRVSLTLGASAADQVGDEYDDDQGGEASSDDNGHDVGCSNVVVAQFGREEVAAVAVGLNAEGVEVDFGVLGEAQVAG